MRPLPALAATLTLGFALAIESMRAMGAPKPEETQRLLELQDYTDVRASNEYQLFPDCPDLMDAAYPTTFTAWNKNKELVTGLVCYDSDGMHSATITDDKRKNVLRVDVPRDILRN